jgi:hypothetical protein
VNTANKLPLSGGASSQQLWRNIQMKSTTRTKYIIKNTAQINTKYHYIRFLYKKIYNITHIALKKNQKCVINTIKRHQWQKQKPPTVTPVAHPRYSVVIGGLKSTIDIL